MYMDIKEIKKDIGNDKFSAKKILSAENHELIYLEIKPFKKLDKHSVDFNTVFYVLDGEGIFEEDEQKFNIKKGSIIKSKLGVPHAIVNKNDSPLILLVTKYK